MQILWHRSDYDVAAEILEHTETNKDYIIRHMQHLECLISGRCEQALNVLGTCGQQVEHNSLRPNIRKLLQHVNVWKLPVKLMTTSIASSSTQLITRQNNFVAWNHKQHDAQPTASKHWRPGTTVLSGLGKCATKNVTLLYSITVFPQNPAV